MTIVLRLLAIIATMLIAIAMAPMWAAKEVSAILYDEVLIPLKEDFVKLRAELERDGKPEGGLASWRSLG